jgi:carbamate kinase
VRVLVALGGNAMTAADGRARPEDQIAAIRAAMEPVAELIAAGHDVVLTHGNGPQVGNLLVKNEVSASVVPPVPLDWCGASTQATIGFTVLNTLEPALARRGIRRPAAALVCRTLVDAADPGFARPTKPVGRYLPEAKAQAMMAHGETWEDRGEKGWRRVVASPEPLEILDAEAVHALVGAGFVVVTSGGGGIPCVRDDDGSIRGIEAVIDKDLSAALLGRALEADVLVIATDVDHVVLGWGTPHAEPLTQATPERMRELAAEGHFASGSMGPKVEAVTRFVENGGRRAVICTLTDIAVAVEGKAGTVVQADDDRTHS